MTGPSNIYNKNKVKTIHIVCESNKFVFVNMIILIKAEISCPIPLPTNILSVTVYYHFA